MAQQPGTAPPQGNALLTCNYCGRHGHEPVDCWALHPELRPARRQGRRASQREARQQAPADAVRERDRDPSRSVAQGGSRVGWHNSESTTLSCSTVLRSMLLLLLALLTRSSLALLAAVTLGIAGAALGSTLTFFLGGALRWDRVVTFVPALQVLRRRKQQRREDRRPATRKPRGGPGHLWVRWPQRGARRSALQLMLATVCCSLVVGAAAVDVAGWGQSATELATGNTHAAGVVAAVDSATRAATELANLPPPTFAVRMTQPGGEESVPPEERHVRDPVHGWIYGNHPQLTQDLKSKLEEMLIDNKDAFAYSVKDLPGYTGALGPFVIELEKPGVELITQPRRYSALEGEIREGKCKELEGGGIIGPILLTRYVSAPTMPAKKDASGAWTERRFCLDFRRINEHTKPDLYGLPLPEDLFNSLGGSTVFSKLDLRAGFHQVPIHPDSQDKTTFWWGRKTYAFKRLPMGLRNATAHFCRMMDIEITRAGLGHCCTAFVDDVLVHSADPSTHIEDVRAVLRMLKAVGLRAHPEKSTFAADTVEYLGFNVNQYGVTPHEAKVAAIRELPVPSNVSELRAVLGLCNYYRVFVPDFSAIANPLNALLKKDAAWEWTAERAAAYEKLKEELCAEGRALRRAEPGLPYTLYCDWSAFGLGAVLTQQHADGNEYMVACISRSNNKHEANYSSYEGEMLCAVWAVKTFRHYLHGTPFTLVTDHQPLTWLMTNPNLTGKYMRWALSLQDYDFTVHHRPGKSHANVDVPSRFPRSSAFDGTGARLDGTPHDAAALPKAACVLVTQPDDSCAVAAPEAIVHFTASLAESPMHRAGSPSTGCGPYQACTGHNPAAPHPDALVEGNLHSQDCATDLDISAQRFDAMRWSAAATTAAIAAANVAAVTVTPAQQSDAARVQSSATRDTMAALNTALLPAEVFHHAATHGVTVVELCGGMCAGLEMVLRNQVKVHRYLYADCSETAQQVARHRLDQLAGMYPDLFALTAADSAFGALPHDIRRITRQSLTDAGAQRDEQWLVVCGWPCQDLSPAGTGKGLAGARSGLLSEVVRILTELQHMQPDRPPAYVLENAAVQHNFSHADIRTSVYAELRRVLGTPVTLDAAQCGARAHRLRNYWTNLAHAGALQTALSQLQRPSHLVVNDVLDPDHVAQLARRDDKPPFYVCNVQGQTLRALPTIVAYPNSHAYKPGGVGRVFNTRRLTYEEPRADERERAMGYNTGATAAPGVTESQRRHVLGNCIDAHAAQALLATSRAVALRAPVSVPAIVTPGDATDSAPVSHQARASMYRMGWSKGEPLGAHAQGLNRPLDPAPRPPRLGLGYPTAELGGVVPAMANVTLRSRQADSSGSQAASPAVRGQAEAPATTPTQPDAVQAPAVQDPAAANDDIWSDSNALYYIEHGTHAEGTIAREQRRVLKRAEHYLMLGGKVVRAEREGELREVPRPSERRELVMQAHTRTGHWGARRTHSLLQQTHWWRGMSRDVAAIVAQCELCARVRVGFAAAQPVLHSLPIHGLMYRWGVDLTGPLPKTRDTCCTYVMVCIEHFTKHIELVPLRAKDAKQTRDAFLTRVVASFGACAEVVTDQGNEFRAEFDDLLRECMIDHRTVAPNNPQANGLAERAVQSVKNALRKHCEQTRAIDDWDVEALPWIQLGYNCSKQASTGYAPYFLLFGHAPVIPPATKQRLEAPVDFDNPQAAATCLLERAATMRQACILAGGNLLVAQHRDAKRYGMVRSGVYHRRIRKFQVGDFVYFRQGQANSKLDTSHYASILRVVELKPNGNMVLNGRCGRTVVANPVNCAPCHLLNIDPTVDTSLARPSRDLPCERCALADQGESMLLCDACGTGWHMHCLQPRLEQIPEGVWVCPRCTELGIAPADVTAPPEPAPAARRQSLFPSASAKRKVEEAKALDGVAVAKALGKGRILKGVAHFKGAARRPYYFDIHYDDNTIDKRVSTTIVKRRRIEEGLTALSAQEEPLPDTWDLTDAAQVQAALRRLMPGEWAATHCTRLANSFATVRAVQHVELPPLVPTTEAEVAPLLQFIDFTRVGGIMDPWAGTCTVQRVFERHQLAVQSSDLSRLHAVPRHADALQPGFYRRAQAEQAIDAVVTSPWFAALDLALPLAVLAARAVACVHVPGHYITDAHPARVHYLRELMREGRLHVLWNLPKGPMGRRCGWVIVFATPQLANWLIRPERRLAAPFSFA